MFVMPTIKDLAQNARQAFRAELPGTDPWLWPSVLHVCAKVWAGIAAALYGRLRSIDRRRFVYTSRGQELDLHGVELGIPRTAATFASGPFDVVGAANQVIPAGTDFVRSDGLVYSVSAATALSAAGTGIVYATATTAGSTGNAVYGTTLTCTLGGVASVTVDTLGVGGGADLQNDEDYRSILLQRKRFTPMGGSLSDYQAWALSVPGVTRVFIDNTGACSFGTVTIYALFDVVQSANYGIPTAAEVASVQAYLNTVAPVGANPLVVAPVAFPIDVVVSNSLTQTATRRQAVSDELYATILRTAAVSTIAAPVTVTLDQLWSAVIQGTGSGNIELASPTADVTVPTGQIAYIRSVTFT